MPSNRPVHFITFGDGSPYMRSAAVRLKFQAERSEWFETTRAYGIGTLKRFPDWFKLHSDFIFNTTKGLGYYIWKPFIIWQTLMTRPIGDFVLYLDAGCEVNVQGLERYLFYKSIANVSSLVAWELPGQSNQKWTKSSLLDFFDTDKNADFRIANMREASFFFIKNSSETRSFFREYSLICTYPGYSLIDDVRSHAGEHKEFKEHRSDQSVFSILTYQRNIGLYIPNESYFNREWETGIHPKEFPIAAMRNKSGKPRLTVNCAVYPFEVGFYQELELDLQTKRVAFGETI